MRKALFLTGALATVAASLPAQSVRWNDRPTDTWSDEAPRVRVSIEGPRAVSYGMPMRVRFEVSDNAFVTVVRVDDNGRMSILFPYSRNQRAAARGGQVHYVRNPRLGNDVSFIANDRMGGYVFALASYAPLDFSSFENRDYDRIGGWSRYTQANRSIARRPDVFIDRFAATVLWDRDTPYDYDVDYYFPSGYPGSSLTNAYALCGAMYRTMGVSRYGTSVWDWDDWDFVGYPYRSMCREWYQGTRCFSYLALYSYTACNLGTIVVYGPTGPVGGQPADTTPIPNEGVVRGGLFPPTPVPVPVNGDPEPQRGELPAGRFDQPRGSGGELDGIMSIPPRATRKMKEEDARRAREAGTGTAPARTTFDRAEPAGRPEKARVADNEPITRAQPPSREPTKAKGTGDPQRETRSKGGYGSTGRTSEPRPSGTERVSRPVETKSTGSSPGSTVNPPSIQGTTTEKKKPPVD